MLPLDKVRPRYSPLPSYNFHGPIRPGIGSTMTSGRGTIVLTVRRCDTLRLANVCT